MQDFNQYEISVSINKDIEKLQPQILAILKENDLTLLDTKYLFKVILNKIESDNPITIES